MKTSTVFGPEDGRNPEIINEKVVLAVFEMTNTFVHNPEVSERVQKALTYADGRELFQRSMRTFSANNRIQELGKDIFKKCVEWFEKADEKSLQMHVEAHTAIYRARCKARSKPLGQLDELRERAKKEREERERIEIERHEADIKVQREAAEAEVSCVCVCVLGVFEWDIMYA